MQYYAFSLCSPSVLFLLLCWRLPESPVWLMRRGREEEARRTLAWLRGGAYDIEPEVEEIREVVAKENKITTTQSVIDVVKSRTFLQPLALTCTLAWSEMIEGYLLVIFKDSGVTPKLLAVLYQV